MDSTGLMTAPSPAVSSRVHPIHRVEVSRNVGREKQVTLYRILYQDEAEGQGLFEPDSGFGVGRLRHESSSSDLETLVLWASSETVGSAGTIVTGVME